MAAQNSNIRLVGTAIKIESVKEEIKTEPVPNTRRKDKSWPLNPKLVHLDRTPCLEECIKKQPLRKK